MSTQIIIIIAVAAILVFVAAGVRRGPRVTQIDRTIRHEEEDEK
jgi:hypothetical protein